jgi:hypothetical protein
MATLGPNIKLTAKRELRDQIHAFYTRGLGASSRAAMPELQIYTLQDGVNLGIYFVEGADALDDLQGIKAAWLEFVVDEVEATFGQLLELGGRELDYHDRTHHYLQAPGGQVFRLAKRQ